MKTRAFVTILVTAATAAGATIAGCSGSNNPSNTSTNGSTAGTTGTGTTTGTAASSSSTTTGTDTNTTSSASSTGTTVSDAGAEDAAVAACPSGLQDKITTCTATDLQVCVKGCGPDLPMGSAQPNLGTKTCTCTTGVYQCANCAYISPLPGCYVEATPAPTCEAGVADKLPCGTACTGMGTGNDVCSIVSDAGKTEGCVCITGGAGTNVWTCATTPW